MIITNEKTNIKKHKKTPNTYMIKQSLQKTHPKNTTKHKKYTGGN